MTSDFEWPDRRGGGAAGHGAHAAPGAASFVDYLQRVSPVVPVLAPPLSGGSAGADDRSVMSPHAGMVHGTTIIALSTASGVLMAGDRRATSGNVIANSDIVKVHPADHFSAIGIAGVAGLGLELIKLFQVELEHYEKIEGTSLSLEGKASRLASMIRGNLGMTMQGLAVVPLFAGFDVATNTGRIYSFDVTGGRYVETDHHGIGSGSWFARGSLKKLWRRGLTEAEAVAVAVAALYDAAEDDSATGGPDVVRRIWPVVAVVDAQGYREIDQDVLALTVDDLIAGRASAATPEPERPRQAAQDPAPSDPEPADTEPSDTEPSDGASA